MTIELLNQIAACQWFTSSFLVISDNVFTPLLYYTYLGAAIPTLLIAIFVFSQGKRTLSKLLLLIMVLCFCVWIFSALVVWATEFPSLTMFFWTTLNLFEPFVYFFAFYFFYVYTFNKDFSFIQKILFTLPVLPSVILAPTTLMLLGYNLADCDRNAVEGVLSLYGYAMEILYVIAIIVVCIIAMRRLKEKKGRAEIISLTVGLCCFLLSFSLGNILEAFTENWYIGQYGLFGAPIFTAILAYLIVRFEVFNIRLLGAQALIATQLLLVSSLLPLESQWYARLVVLISLVFVAISGYYLIRAVKNDKLLNENLAQLSKNLQTSNEKLQFANTRLVEVDQRKDEFLSIASHQLRTPIATIKGYSANILDETYGKVTEAIKAPLEIIRDTSQLMSMYIEDYLNVSRIEQGRMKYDFQNIDLKELLFDVLQEFMPSAQKRHLELQLEAKDSLVISADPAKIRQVVGNIVDNAIKYTEHGKVAVSLAKALDRAIITIQDTGVGISPDEIGGLFTKFQRSREAHTINMSGTGLGLYVAKQLAEGHKGSIDVQSQGLGRGAVFTIKLPITR
jgi:signal transduction histidine kinase